jgi:hypothetical protein
MKIFGGMFRGKEIIKEKSGPRKFAGRSLKTINSSGDMLEY